VCVCVDVYCILGTVLIYGDNMEVSCSVPGSLQVTNTVLIIYALLDIDW
jgi:hypothetical protein